MRSSARPTEVGGAASCAPAEGAQKRPNMASVASVPRVERLGELESTQRGIIGSTGTGELPIAGRRIGVQPALEGRHQKTSHAARLAGSDRPAVELHDRRDVARRAGHEQFLESPKLLLVDRRLTDVHALLDRELEHDISRYARKDEVALGIRAQLAAQDAEHVRV